MAVDSNENQNNDKKREIRQKNWKMKEEGEGVERRGGMKKCLFTFLRKTFKEEQ